MTNPVPYVLLDLDGTLTNPREGIMRCLRYALERMEVPCPGDAELEGHIGPPLGDCFAALLGSDDKTLQQRAIGIFRERFASIGLFENAVYAGIPEALAGMRAAGHRLMVCTSKPTVFARRIVEHFSLAEHFGDAIHGSELDGRFSVKADLLGAILEQRGISPGEALMVGDRSHDVVAARANGVRSIGALWGFGSREELVQAGADALCEEPSSLERVLRESIHVS